MNPSIFDLSGKTAAITGGSRGLGFEMAKAFASAGAKVVVASRKLEQCESAAREIEALGGVALPVACHVGEWGQVEALIDTVYREFGSLDIVVNNAGMSPRYDKVSEVTEALFDKVIDVNLKGPFRLCALAGERMAAADGGSIINVSSTAAVTPSPSAEPYGAAKAGLNALTRSFAYAFGPKVRVNGIMPGPFMTDISKAWDLDKFAELAEQLIPLKRGGQPQEIIGAALYLASDAASYSTGSIITVDGGCAGNAGLA
ncbi:MAG: SDR family NAD(P)-dependent oxidoreductase [Gammaproteobacteria bacterium]